MTNTRTLTSLRLPYLEPVQPVLAVLIHQSREPTCSGIVKCCPASPLEQTREYVRGSGGTVAERRVIVRVIELNRCKRALDCFSACSRVFYEIRRSKENERNRCIAVAPGYALRWQDFSRDRHCSREVRAGAPISLREHPANHASDDIECPVVDLREFKNTHERSEDPRNSMGKTQVVQTLVHRAVWHWNTLPLASGP